MGALCRYLRSVATAVPVVGDLSQAATAAASLVALVVGGGVVLGIKVSPGAGLGLALGVLLVLAVIGGVGLQTRLDALKGNAPVVEIGDEWWKRELVGSGVFKSAKFEWAEFVGFELINRGAVEVEHVWAELVFSLPGGEPFLAIQARPSHAPRARVGEPFEAPRFTQVTLPGNGKPEPFDVAVRFEEDGRRYALNTRALVSGGRHEPFEMQGRSFVVAARVRGSGGIDLQRRWRCDAGSDFRLVEDRD